MPLPPQISSVAEHLLALSCGFLRHFEQIQYSWQVPERQNVEGGGGRMMPPNHAKRGQQPAPSEGHWEGCRDLPFKVQLELVPGRLFLGEVQPVFSFSTAYPNVLAPDLQPPHLPPDLNSAISCVPARWWHPNVKMSFTAWSYLLAKPTVALTKGHWQPSLRHQRILHNPQRQLAAVALMNIC